MKYTEEFKKRFNYNSDEALSKMVATKLGLNSNQRRFIEIKNINTGEINKFLFANKACIFLNCCSSTIYENIKKNTIYKKKYQLSYKIETLPNLTNIKSEIKSGNIRWVIIKNINTGEINKFKSINKASIFLNCSRSTLYKYINNKIIFKEKYKIYLEIESIL
jgi:predicted DNA-binding transcriptional regulator AlpA